MVIDSLEQLYQLFSENTYVFRFTGIKFPVAQMAFELENNIIPNYLPVWQTSINWETGEMKKFPINDSGKNYFGGWSILADKPNYDSGWEPTGKFLSGRSFNKDYTNYKVPTELYYGPFKETVDLLKKHDFEPYRVRITIVKKDHELKWHSDLNGDNIVLRFQIPIITNPSVYFCTRKQKWHMPSDGYGYFLNANHEHKVVNTESHRYIILANVVIKQQHLPFLEVLSSEVFHE